MNRWLKIIIGTILLAGAIALILPSMPLQNWGQAALNLVKAGITIFIILLGLILIILGINELTE
jgi:energy-converting hydrogenase Eha subunit C